MVTKEIKKKGYSDGIDITGREFYDFYRENRRRAVPWLKDHTLFRRTIGAMIREIADMMIEADGGVYLEGLGYFGVIMSPKKSRKRLSIFNTFKNNYESIKKKYRYSPYFFGDIDRRNFRDWSMSSSFNLQFLKKVRKSKTKYYLCYTALKQLYKANKLTKQYRNANNKANNI